MVSKNDIKQPKCCREGTLISNFKNSEFEVVVHMMSSLIPELKVEGEITARDHGRMT